ncbi:MAG TPA: TerC/Alx family metal homeostasis membrane protein [Vicinamibacterales bacterium]|nr:TerC/Alx family metal homeostasis membrane protein [Vicinamibacterales bacterium]
MRLFPFAEYWWFYLGFTGLVLVLLAIDLGVFHRKAHAVSIREAARWSVVWISLSLIFNVAFYQYAQYALASDAGLMAQPGFDPEAAARRAALEFLAGYVVEYTLSVDNMFVFVVIFSFFRVPALLQHRVLFYGILGALLFRGLFIALGSVLLSYHWVVVLFGAMLIVTGFKMLGSGAVETDPSKNPLVRLTRRLLPVTEDFQGKHFFTRIGGQLHATPLFLTLVAIEVSDIVFAIDSVPAIFALTQEPLIVFTSNVFAILGLRSLYFVLAAAVVQFSLLRFGLAGVLMFIGLKMIWLNQAFDGHFPISWSLAIIGTLVGGSIVASLMVDRRKKRA